MAKEYIERDAKNQQHFERERSKSTALIEVERVIYAHMSKWVGSELIQGQSIPNIRKRSFANRMPDTVFVGESVAAILKASRIYKTPELKERLEALEKIKAQAESMRRGIAELDNELMASAKNAATNLQPNLEGRVIAAMGADVAAYMGLEIIAIGAVEQIAHLKYEIGQRPKKAGAAKNEAAHRVALESARLYAKATGKKPTYSENSDGLHGEYTPFLRAIYDAFGWKKLSLKLPAKEAINALSERDYRLDLIPLFPSI